MPFGYVSEIRREGRAEGRIEGMGEVVLSVLERRGIEVDHGQRQQIMEAPDEDTMKRRLRLAMTTESAADLLSATRP